eukprot:747865-Hanusia_phi.AAC.3
MACRTTAAVMGMLMLMTTRGMDEGRREGGGRLSGGGESVVYHHAGRWLEQDGIVRRGRIFEMRKNVEDQSEALPAYALGEANTFSRAISSSSSLLEASARDALSPAPSVLPFDIPSPFSCPLISPSSPHWMYPLRGGARKNNQQRKNSRDKFASQVALTQDFEKIEKKKKSIKKFVQLSDLPTEEQEKIINNIPNMTNSEILSYSFPNPKKVFVCLLARAVLTPCSAASKEKKDEQEKHNGEPSIAGRTFAPGMSSESSLPRPPREFCTVQGKLDIRTFSTKESVL